MGAVAATQADPRVAVRRRVVRATGVDRGRAGRAAARLLRRDVPPVRRRAGQARWGEKTPFHTSHMAQMARIFPDAAFVGIVRHPGAVASSLHRRFHYGFAEAVAYWSDTNQEMLAGWHRARGPVRAVPLRGPGAGRRAGAARAARLPRRAVGTRGDRAPPRAAREGRTPGRRGQHGHLRPRRPQPRRRLVRDGRRRRPSASSPDRELAAFLGYDATTRRAPSSGRLPGIRGRGSRPGPSSPGVVGHVRSTSPRTSTATAAWSEPASRSWRPGSRGPRRPLPRVRSAPAGTGRRTRCARCSTGGRSRTCAPPGGCSAKRRAGAVGERAADGRGEPGRTGDRRPGGARRRGLVPRHASRPAVHLRPLSVRRRSDLRRVGREPTAAPVARGAKVRTPHTATGAGRRTAVSPDPGAGRGRRGGAHRAGVRRAAPSSRRRSPTATPGSARSAPGPPRGAPHDPHGACVPGTAARDLSCGRAGSIPRGTSARRARRLSRCSGRWALAAPIPRRDPDGGATPPGRRPAEDVVGALRRTRGVPRAPSGAALR